MRLDNYLAEHHPEQSRSTWQKLIKQGLVRVNDEIATIPKQNILEGAKIHLDEQETPKQKQELPVIYEDDDVVVVDKPAGMLTHAKGALHEEYSVADFIKPKTSYNSNTNRAGIIHRLDRDTSGVLLLVKNEKAATMLMKQFQNRTVKKTYYAVVDGIPSEQEAMIDVPIGRNPKAPSTFRGDPIGKSAQTHYIVDKFSDERSLVRLLPKTGRTHQLRVHLAHIKHPIVGDKVYGKKDKRMYLHAAALELTLPNNEHHIFTSKLPDEFSERL